MPQKLIEAYDTRTGAKLPQRVPESWTRLFPNVSATPTQRAADAVAVSDDVPEADSPQDVAPTSKTARRGRQTPVKES